MSESQTYTTIEDWNARRTLTTSAGFFMPHLRPGMRLLDAGCGPGSITLDFGEALAPGEVIGIDTDEGTLARAKKALADRPLANVRFEKGDIYDLQFPDASFDAVWTSSIMQWLNNPRGALKEIFRVLKPGGVYATRDRDRRGDIFGNSNRLVKRARDLHWRQNEYWSGGDKSIGGKTRAMIMRAGFENVTTVASYENHGEPGAARFIVGLYDRALKVDQRPGSVKIIKEKGWANDDDLARMIEAWQAWGDDPRSFYCICRVANVAWKPTNT
jgi:ubiquinone/menaquinone biosynthesis C-methylase UbiE